MPKIQRPQAPSEAPHEPPVTLQELDDALGSLPDQLRHELRRATVEAAHARHIKHRGEAALARATEAFTVAINAASEYHVTTVPWYNRDEDQWYFAYLRVDELLNVDHGELREYLLEYFKMREDEDDELALIHTTEILDQVTKPAAVDLDAYRKAVEKKIIPGEIHTAAAKLVPKKGWVAFEKPKAG